MPSRRTLAIAAWTVMVAWVALLSWQNTQTNERFARESYAGRLVACRVLNADRAALHASNVGFGEVLIASSQPQPGETPAERAQRDAQIESFRKRVADQNAPLAEPIPCAEFARDPERYLRERRGGP